jgi:exosome complex RNA-binding protein Rrp42 (RNase PH superfamily)
MSQGAIDGRTIRRVRSTGYHSAVSVDPRTIPTPFDSVVWTEIDGEVVVVDPRLEEVHLLSETAAILWQLLDGEASIQEIADDVADAFEIPIEQAVRDVSEFAELMNQRSLVALDRRAKGHDA